MAVNVKRWVNLRPQYVDGSGNPLSGGRLFFYQNGTSTKQNTYTDSTGVTPNSNPVVLNSLGEPSTEIWMATGQMYKVGLAVAGVDDPPASFIWTEDNISGVNDVSVALQGSQWITFIGVPTFVSATSFTVPGDQRQIFDNGRRVQTTNTGGTVYSNVSAASAYDGIKTTVVLTNDSGALDAGISAVFYGILSAVNSSIPPHAGNIPAVQDQTDQTKDVVFSVSALPTATRRIIDATLIGNVPLFNGTLVASVAANALTIALKTIAGGDPSGSDPVFASFRDTAIATGGNSVLTLTAAQSLVVSSGSTLGASNGVPFKLWIVGFNDAGVFRLGVINCLSGLNIYPLGQVPLASSTAEGGAGNADSAQVFYTGTAVAAKAYVVLGYLSFETGLAAVGTWNAGPTRIQLQTPNSPLPGAILQTQQTATGAVATGTTVLPYDDTIPQSAEGDQYMSQAITPTSAANVLRVTSGSEAAANAGNLKITTALFQDAVANALAAVTQATGATLNLPLITTLSHVLLAQTTAATTFKLRIGLDSAGTLTFNGVAAARLMGGVMNSYLRIEEMMA